MGMRSRSDEIEGGGKHQEIEGSVKETHCGEGLVEGLVTRTRMIIKVRRMERSKSDRVKKILAAKRIPNALDSKRELDVGRDIS